MAQKSGPGNSQWKGDAAGIYQLHRRVEKARGKPQHCEKCGTTDPTKSYQWANLTRRYQDVTDYVRLCGSCHRAMDAQAPARMDYGDQKAAAGRGEGMGTMRLCKCGCGGEFPEFDYHGRPREFIRGHYQKWLQRLLVRAVGRTLREVADELHGKDER